MEVKQDIDFENKPEWLFEKFMETGKEYYIEKLVNMINPWLFKMIYRITGDREAAKDILQESWFLVLKGSNRIDSQNGNLNGYFFTVAKREAVRWVKQNRTVNKAGDIANIPYNDDNIGKEDLGSVLRSAIMKIKNSDIRNCMYLFYYAELNINEIAETLNTSRQNVKNRLLRGRSKLKTILTKNREYSSVIESITMTIFILIFNGLNANG